MHKTLPIQFIMVHPSHPGNIGAACRAIKTMGFYQLGLVAPENHSIKQDPQAIALSSSANDVLQEAHLYPTLSKAVADSTLIIGMTARPRDRSPKHYHVRQMAQEVQTHLVTPNTKVSILFGTERHGLLNEELLQCHRLCYIPANPNYSSLNVSAAIQLVSWELHYTLTQTLCTPPTFQTNTHHQTTYATGEDVEGLLNHWEKMLIHTGFHDPKTPKRLMQRMRQFFMRSELSKEEIQIFRGICSKILNLNKSKENNRP